MLWIMLIEIRMLFNSDNSRKSVVKVVKTVPKILNYICVLRPQPVFGRSCEILLQLLTPYLQFLILRFKELDHARRGSAFFVRVRDHLAQQREALVLLCHCCFSFRKKSANVARFDFRFQGVGFGRPVG
ncbi:hypothetical protein EV281_1128 [Rhizobium sp. BK418]|nr:hypothetical protein EV281_1128 [Rhizobium sp. BK418]